jgi:hypothetical protein
MTNRETAEERRRKLAAAYDRKSEVLPNVLDDEDDELTMDIERRLDAMDLDVDERWGYREQLVDRTVFKLPEEARDMWHDYGDVWRIPVKARMRFAQIICESEKVRIKAKLISKVASAQKIVDVYKRDKQQQTLEVLGYISFDI